MRGSSTRCERLAENIFVVPIDIDGSADPQLAERSMKLLSWDFEQAEKTAKISVCNLRASLHPEHISHESLYFSFTITPQEAYFSKNKGGHKER